MTKDKVIINNLNRLVELLERKVVGITSYTCFNCKFKKECDKAYLPENKNGICVINNE